MARAQKVEIKAEEHQSEVIESASPLAPNDSEFTSDQVDQDTTASQQTVTINTIADKETASSIVESIKTGLLEEVSKSAREAYSSGDMALHAMLNDIQVTLGELHVKLSRVEGDAAEMLRKLHAIL